MSSGNVCNAQLHFMDGGRSENIEGASSNMGEGIISPLVEIGLTDLPGTCAPYLPGSAIPAFFCLASRIWCLTDSILKPTFSTHSFNLVL